MKATRRSLVFALILALTAAVPVAPAAAQNTKKGGGLSVPVAGADNLGGKFAGTLFITKFVKNGNGIDAIGTLNATSTDVSGVSRNIVTQVAWPLNLAAMSASGADVAPAAISAQAVCDILHLVLGPLHLDLLGLVIDLNQVELDITAVSGAGNLLGNLLCAITGLLDGPTTAGILSQISNLLNQLLGILG